MCLCIQQLQLAERRVKILNAIEKYTSDVGGVNDMDAVLMAPLLKLESQLSAIIDLQQYGVMTHGKYTSDVGGVGDMDAVLFDDDYDNDGGDY